MTMPKTTKNMPIHLPSNQSVGEGKYYTNVYITNTTTSNSTRPRVEKVDTILMFISFPNIDWF